MKRELFISVAMVIALVSCSDDNISVESPDFFIEAEVDGVAAQYPQVNFESINTSNKYFTEFEETWLQAYKDESDLGNGFWQVRLHNLDIQNIQLPYTLSIEEGNVTWFDSQLDDFIMEDERCQGIDSGCTFLLEAGVGENTITVLRVSEDEIEGTFSGVAILKGTGFSPFQDESMFHEITDGKFLINYRTE